MNSPRSKELPGRPIDASPETTTVREGDNRWDWEPATKESHAQAKLAADEARKNLEAVLAADDRQAATLLHDLHMRGNRPGMVLKPELQQPVETYERAYRVLEDNFRRLPIAVEKTIVPRRTTLRIFDAKAGRKKNIYIHWGNIAKALVIFEHEAAEKLEEAGEFGGDHDLAGPRISEKRVFRVIGSRDNATLSIAMGFLNEETASETDEEDDWETEEIKRTANYGERMKESFMSLWGKLEDVFSDPSLVMTGRGRDAAIAEDERQGAGTIAEAFEGAYAKALENGDSVTARTIFQLLYDFIPHWTGPPASGTLAESLKRYGVEMGIGPYRRLPSGD